MSVDRKSIPIDQLTTEQPESTHPAYLAWKRAKIEAALKHADEHPQEFLTEQETWKKFGIDY